jgi:hypothetical protein
MTAAEAIRRLGDMRRALEELIRRPLKRGETRMNRESIAEINRGWRRDILAIETAVEALRERK